MKLISRVVPPLAIGVLCTWLVVRKMDGPAVLAALSAVRPSSLGLYVLTLAATHLFRATRWRFLLRPLGVVLPGRRLLAISSVGFMTILALPFRLGEFVRPYYVKRETRTSMSSVLGTVAVERIVDGLVVSLVFFVAYLASGGGYSPVLRFGAWLSLLGFLGAAVFLAFALKWPEQTIGLGLRLALVHRLAPKLAVRIAEKVRALIRGFAALAQPSAIIPFLLETVLYWGTNGLGMWLLARHMGLPISLAAAFAAMAFTGVVISLPNAPGNIGQFQYGVVLALGAYLGDDVIRSTGAAYAWLLWALQSLWYLVVGLLALRFAGTGSLRDVVRASQEAASEGSEAPVPDDPPQQGAPA